MPPCAAPISRAFSRAHHPYRAVRSLARSLARRPAHPYAAPSLCRWRPSIIHAPHCTAHIVHASAARRAPAGRQMRPVPPRPICRRNFVHDHDVAPVRQLIIGPYGQQRVPHPGISRLRFHRGFDSPLHWLARCLLPYAPSHFFTVVGSKPYACRKHVYLSDFTFHHRYITPRCTALLCVALRCVAFRTDPTAPFRRSAPLAEQRHWPRSRPPPAWLMSPLRLPRSASLGDHHCHTACRYGKSNCRTCVDSRRSAPLHCFVGTTLRHRHARLGN